MKNMYTSSNLKKGLLLFCTFFIFLNTHSQQAVQWRSYINDIRYQESGCIDCLLTDPDPRFRFRTKDTGTSTWFDQGWDADNTNCNWISTQFSPPTWAPPYNFAGGNGWISTPAINNQIQLQFDGWEPDPWPCGPDDASCGGQGDMTFSSGSPINSDLRIGEHCAPCTLSNQIVHSRNCNSDGTTGTYSAQWRYEWRYNQAPTITTEPAANTTYCYGTAATALTVAVANDFYGRVGASGMLRHVKWQVSNATACPGSGWLDIPGATSASFTPPQITGTRLYRALIT